MNRVMLRLVSIVSVWFFSMGAQSAEYELMLGYSTLKGTTYQDVAEQIEERVFAATDGRVKVSTNASLLSGSQLAPGVRDGLIDMALIVPPYYAATQPILGTLALPGLVTSVEDYRTLMDGFLGGEFEEMWGKAYNSHVLMDPPFCEQEMMSTKVVRDVKGFQGLKVRVHNPETGRLISQVGARPTALPAAEVLPGLQQGVIDGVFTAGCWAQGSGFAPVIDYAIQWKVASYLPWTMLVNKNRWESLPENLQSILKNEFDAWQDEIYSNYHKRAAKIRKGWEELGVNYEVAADDEVQQLMQERYTRPVYQAWYRVADDAGIDGEAVIERARETLKAD